METALDIDKTDGDTILFKPVNLTRFVDSPGQIGQYYKTFDVTGTSPVKHTLDVLADSPSALNPSSELLQKITHIHEEAEAMIGARHYNHYQWLLTLSDIGGSEGLEHHESSEDGVYEKSLVDPDLQFDLADLLSHEYFHSFNGKFRRPAGLGHAGFRCADDRRSTLGLRGPDTVLWPRDSPARRLLERRKVARNPRGGLSRNALQQGPRLASPCRHSRCRATHLRVAKGLGPYPSRR